MGERLGEAASGAGAKIGEASRTPVRFSSVDAFPGAVQAASAVGESLSGVGSWMRISLAAATHSSDCAEWVEWKSQSSPIEWEEVRELHDWQRRAGKASSQQG